MSDELFNVIFRGDILPGFNLADVKAKFGQLFKMEPAKVEQFFTGRPMVLKANCDRATGDKFKAVLTQAGALVEVRAATAQQPAAPQPQAPAATAVPSQPVAPRPAAAPADPWSVAPVGNLVRPGEIPQADPVQVDISQISLVKRNPFAADAEEPLEASRDVPPPALDLSGLAVGAVGETLVEFEEFVPLELDLSALSLDPVGSDVLREDEREQVVPVAVDISAISLAPPGGELGEIPRPAAPPPPSTDHLSVQK